MSLSEKQIEEIKNQISEQIKHLPEEQQKLWREKINSMSPEELEDFVKQQMSQQDSKGIFRSIVDRDIPSLIIQENQENIAVLEIKPISKGHVIIIPLSPALTKEDLSKSSFELAEEISKTLIKKLKAKKTEILSQTLFGETIINVIPIYDTNSKITLQSPRTEASEKELQELFILLKKEKKKKIIDLDKKTSSKKSNQKIIKLNRRIP